MSLDRSATGIWQIVLLVVSLIATCGRSYALTQRIDLYRTNPELDTIPQRRLNNVLYYGTVQLGTPAQPVTVCIDTGSAVLWTPADSFSVMDSSTSGKAQSAITERSGFVASASSSLQIVAKNFSEKYISVGVVGLLGSDTLQVADASVGNASIGLVTQASINLTGASCDGILGLARPGLTRSGRPVFYKMLSDKGLLDQPTFSIWLNPNTTAQPAGALLFGGVDSAFYTGSLIPVPVISSKYWMVPLLDVRVDGVIVPATARGAILHSGSALSLLTAKDYLYLGASVPGAKLSKETGVFEIPGGCSNISALPDITFNMMTGNFTLTPQQYVVQMGPRGACSLAFQPGAPDDTIVLGANFLRAYYTAYTYNSTSKSSYVSLAPAAMAGAGSSRRRAQEFPQETLGGYPSDPGTAGTGITTPATAASPPPAQATSPSQPLAAPAPAPYSPSATPATTPAATPPTAPAPAPVPLQLLAAPVPAPAAPSVAPTPAANIAAAPVLALAPVEPSAMEAAAPGASSPPPTPIVPVLGGDTPLPQTSTAAAAPFITILAAPVPAPAPAQAVMGYIVLPASAPSPLTSSKTPSVPSPALQPAEVAQFIAPAPATLAAAQTPAPSTSVRVPTQPPKAIASAPAPLASLAAATAEAVPLVAPAPAAAMPAPAQAPVLPPAAALKAQAAPGPAVPTAQPPLLAATLSPAASPPSLPAASIAKARAAAPTPVPAPLMQPLAASPKPAATELAAAAPVPLPAPSAQEARAPAAAAAPEKSAAVASSQAPAALPQGRSRAPGSAAVAAAVAAAQAAAAAPAASAKPAPRAPRAGPSLPVHSYSQPPLVQPEGTPAPAPSLEVPLQAAPQGAPAPVAAATSAAAAPFSPALAPAPAPFTFAFPAAPLATLGLAPAESSGPAFMGPVPSVAAPAMAAAPLRQPAAQAPAPAIVAPVAAPAAAVPAFAPMPATAVAGAGAPAFAAAAASPPAATASAPSTAPVPAPPAAPVGAELQAPAPGPSVKPIGSRGPFGMLVPGHDMSAAVVPLFKALPGIEALYGGLGSLWHLPLQTSDINDTLFSLYLAKHPLTAKQNATLAKPRPPTMPGFGQPVSLVALDENLDSCVVGWSSVNSCRAKGLNDTICSLMPVFDDVTIIPSGCPFKNETKVELPLSSGNYVPISQQWLLVRAGTNVSLTRGGQQIYNPSLGKCLDVCKDASPYSQCGHVGNVFLEDCDSTSLSQQWRLTATAMANATLAAADRSNLTKYQISSFFVDPAANVTVAANGSEAAVSRTCLDTCDSQRSANTLSDEYQQTVCNLLLPTYPSSSAVFPCNSRALPHRVLQGFAIFTPAKTAAS